MAHRAWCEAGCPGEGPLFDEKRNMRRAVRRRVRWCAGRREKSCIERREKQFADGDHRRFRHLEEGKQVCEIIYVSMGNLLKTRMK